MPEKKRHHQNLNRVQQKLLSLPDVLFLLKQKELTCDLLSSMPGYQTTSTMLYPVMIQKDVIFL